jgi:hypothetical protein
MVRKLECKNNLLRQGGSVAVPLMRTVCGDMANADAARGKRKVSFTPSSSIPYYEHWVLLQMKSILRERPSAILE